MRLPAKPFCFAIALALTSRVLPATASELQIQAGRSYMDSYATNALFVEGVFGEHPIGDSRFSWSPDVSLGWLNGRDLARYRNSQYTTQDDVWLLAAGARFHYGADDRWYHRLFFSFQPAVQSGRTLALSNGYEFVSTLGWQGKRFSVQLRHVSDAGLHGSNRGETMALVGVGFDL